MGGACGKAEVEQQDTKCHYHVSCPAQAHHPTAIPHANSCIPSASPLPADSTPSNGITVYPLYETSPIVNRCVNTSRFKVKTSFDVGTAADDLTSAVHNAVDANMLKQQMEVLSRLRKVSVSANCTEGPGGPLKPVVA